ncbi:MAG: hypothetical protein RLZZ592_1542 [Pseudomonadota bacterium]|jgi:hypothetical protein|nr:hypothetical protein [Pseudomonadota bacterium]
MTTPTQRGSIDDRKEPRYQINWRARMTLPDGQVMDVRLQDISQSGVGMLSDVPVPGNSIISVVMGVPDPDNLARVMGVPVQVHIAYVVLNNHDFRVGGKWVNLNPAARDLLQAWIRRLSFQD